MRTPKPFLGIDLVSVIIYGLNEGDDGTLTVDSYVVVGSTPPDIRNTIRHNNLTGSPGHQEINAMNTRQRNQVIIDDGVTMDIQVFNVNNTYDSSPLTTMWLSYDYFMVVWQEGTVPGSITVNTCYGVRGDLDKPLEGRGEQLTTLHFLEMDPGSPTISQWTRVYS